MNKISQLLLLCIIPIVLSSQATPCTSVITQFPVIQSFEGNDLWTQTNNAHVPWLLNAGPTPTQNTGPSGASDGILYMYVEATNQLGAGILESPCFDLRFLQNPQLSFDYNLSGPDALRFVIQPSIDGGITWSTPLLFMRSQDQGPGWNSEIVDLTPYSNSSNFRFRIIGTVNSINGDLGDVALDNIVIGDPPAPCFQISVNSTNVSCNSNNDGTASVSILPANTTGLSILWSTGETTSSIANLSPGNYFVRVTDNNNCISIENFTISNSQPITAQLFITPTSGINNSDGRIHAQISGGTPPYSVIWYNGNVGSTNFNVSTGYEEIKITDSNGCVIKMPTFVPVSEICTNRYNNWPYHLSFDNGVGRFKQGTDDDNNWGRRRTSTPTPNTGPSAPAEGIRYRYLESSGAGGPLKTGTLVSKRCFNISNLSNPELSFQYHMYGSQMGQLFIQVSTDGGYVWRENIWETEGDLGDVWNQAFIDLSPYSTNNLLIRIVARTGQGQLSDIAIDDLHIRSAGASSSILIDNIEPFQQTNIEPESKELKYYPNPVNDLLSLKYDESFSQLQILNIQGTIVKKVNLEGTNTQLDIGELNTGVYIIRVFDFDQNVFTYKLHKL